LILRIVSDAAAGVSQRRYLRSGGFFDVRQMPADAGCDGVFVTTISGAFLLFPFGCHTDLV
jgi:hypothetical protein